MGQVNKMRAVQILQIKAARALTGWTQAQLGEAAGLSALTVKRFETGAGVVSDDAIERMRRALEAAGVEFIPENGGGAGVRLKRK